MYSDRTPVYCSGCFFGDKWSGIDYGMEVSFDKPFLGQLDKLLKSVPRLFSYTLGNLINSEFSNYSVNNKNVYLAYSVVDCEDVMYSEIIDKSKNTFDSYSVNKIDSCSYNVDCEENYNVHYAIKCTNCMDSYFLYDCRNCQNCCLSSNLRNRQYVFRNKKVSKEEYQKLFNDLNLNLYISFEKTKNEFDERLINNSIHKYANIQNSKNVTGDYIHNSKNARNVFDLRNGENITFSVRQLNAKDSYDCQGSGLGSELIYESNAATQNGYKDFFCYQTAQGCKECEYSLLLRNCSNCFGCVGLLNSEYCVLNRKYKKEGYFEMVEKIKRHMMDMPYIDKKGRIYKYGEFYPFEMSPFGYNETTANDYFPITKEEAIQAGYPWKEREKRDYQITKKSEDLPDSILDVKKDILNEVIFCPNEGNQMFQCTTAFKIVPNELQFYQQKKLPLPRYCPNCRHYQRLKYRNPMHLYSRKCMKENCQNEFKTSYAPDRPEIVYCESCYNKEVY